MFGIVFYIIACAVIACVLTIVVGFFRPIKQNDDWKPWKYILGIGAFIGALPYIYVEVLTSSKGAPLKKGVVEAFEEAGVPGPLVMYKVLKFSNKKSHVIAIAQDKNEFGQPERAIFEIDLVNGQQGWSADAYTIVYSFKRQRDASTMPPYW